MLCNCTGPGFCKTHNRHMSDVRHNECKNKPGYFEVFQEAKDGPKQNTEATFNSFNRKTVEQQIGKGPGTELILLLASPMLKRLGIKVTTGCKCLRHARMMNEQGPDWCVKNIEVVTGWLKDEYNHQRIRIPFLKSVTVIMIRTAIKRARKKDVE